MYIEKDAPTTVLTNSTRDSYTGTPIIDPNSFPVSTQETDRIKWWQALIAGVVAVIAPPFGAAAGAALVAYWSGGSDKGAGDNIPASDKAIVDDWVKTVLATYLARITKQPAQVLTDGITLANLQILNDCLAQLCIVKTYFATNDNTTFLGEAALQYRYDIVAELCDAFGKTIADRIATSGLSVALQPTAVNAGKFNFQPLIQRTITENYNCFGYAPSAKGGGVQTIGELPVSPATPTTTTTGNGKNTTQGVNKTMLVLGGGLLAWALYETVSGGKKKSKAN